MNTIVVKLTGPAACGKTLAANWLTCMLGSMGVKSLALFDEGQSIPAAEYPFSSIEIEPERFSGMKIQTMAPKPHPIYTIMHFLLMAKGPAPIDLPEADLDYFRRRLSGMHVVVITEEVT